MRLGEEKDKIGPQYSHHLFLRVINGMQNAQKYWENSLIVLDLT